MNVKASLILGVSLILSVVAWQELAEANHTAELTNCMAHVQLLYSDPRSDHSRTSDTESGYLAGCVRYVR